MVWLEGGFVYLEKLGVRLFTPKGKSMPLLEGGAHLVHNDTPVQRSRIPILHRRTPLNPCEKRGLPISPSWRGLGLCRYLYRVAFLHILCKLKQVKKLASAARGGLLENTDKEDKRYK